MAKYKYDCKYKTLSIPLFEEDGTILYDCISIGNNKDIKSLYIYNRIRFDRKYIISFPICYSFTDTKCEEAVRSKMKDIMQRNPYVSSSEIMKITGHSKSSITRHYMILKREIIGSILNNISTERLMAPKTVYKHIKRSFFNYLKFGC